MLLMILHFQIGSAWNWSLYDKLNPRTKAGRSWRKIAVDCSGTPIIGIGKSPLKNFSDEKAYIRYANELKNANIKNE
jgi:hypothetical protein